MIEITRVEIRIPAFWRRPGPIVAYAAVTLAGSLTLDNFQVKRATSGRLTVSFPLKPNRVVCPSCGCTTFAPLPRCHRCHGRHVHEGSRRYGAVALPVGPAVHAHFESAILHAYCDATTTQKAS